jgi:hypothetical protein
MVKSKKIYFTPCQNVIYLREYCYAVVRVKEMPRATTEYARPLQMEYYSTMATLLCAVEKMTAT